MRFAHAVHGILSRSHLVYNVICTRARAHASAHYYRVPPPPAPSDNRVTRESACRRTPREVIPKNPNEIQLNREKRRCAFAPVGTRIADVSSSFCETIDTPYRGFLDESEARERFHPFYRIAIFARIYLRDREAPLDRVRVARISARRICGGKKKRRKT